MELLPSSLFHQLWHVHWTIFDSKNNHLLPPAIYGVHWWCQELWTTQDEWDLQGSLQCFFIDSRAHPAIPPSCPPMDWAVPIPCCSLFMLYVGSTQRLVSGGSCTAAILSHYFSYLVPMQIHYVAFYVGPIQTGFRMTFLKSYGGIGIMIPVKNVPQEQKKQESWGFLQK